MSRSGSTFVVVLAWWLGLFVIIVLLILSEAWPSTDAPDVPTPAPSSQSAPTPLGGPVR